MSRNKNRKRRKATAVRSVPVPAERRRSPKSRPTATATAPKPAGSRGIAWRHFLSSSDEEGYLLKLFGVIPWRQFLHWPEARYGRWFFLVLILAATWLVYMEGLTGGWLLDDYGNIVNNGALAMHGFSWAQLWHAMWSFNAGPLGRPLSLATFALQRTFAGLDPGGFKTVNLAMHLVAVVLLYGFTRALLLAWRRRRAADTSKLRIEWVALAVAAAWALHPMNLTPVLYAVQRETIFAALFTLAGLWLYAYLRERLATTWPALILLAVVVAVFTALGALAKETGVLLPLFTLILEAFVFRFRDTDGRGARKLWWLYAVLLFLPAAIGLYDKLPGVFHGAYVTREFTLDERLLTEGRVVIFYLGLILVPRLPAMALHHDDIALSTSILSPPATLGAFLIIAALLIFAWWQRRRLPLLSLGIVWFFAAQVLTATVFPLEIAYEHRVYLADWGIILAVASLTLLRVRAPRLRTLVTIAASLVIVVLGLTTAARAWTWRSNLSLAHAEARNHPQSPRGTYLLARIETNLALGGQHQYMQPAFEAAQRATQVENAGLDPWVAMVLLAAQTGRPVPDAWFDGMVKAVGERPFTVSDVNALEALVSCYTKHQCRIQPGEIERLFRAIDKSPRLEKLGMNYANVLVTEANFIGYDTPAKRARSAPLLLKSANAVPGVAQFQLNVFNVSLQNRDFALAQKMLARVEKLNKLGKLNLMLEGMHRRMAAARAATPAPGSR